MNRNAANANGFNGLRVAQPTHTTVTRELNTVCTTTFKETTKNFKYILCCLLSRHHTYRLELTSGRFSAETSSPINRYQISFFISFPVGVYRPTLVSSTHVIGHGFLLTLILLGFQGLECHSFSSL